MTVRDDYAQTLDGLRVLAQRDLLAWWRQTEGLGFIEQKLLLEEPFQAIVAAYGEQAAYAAADYLFLQRSLDDTLRELEYPEIADPVGFEQARGSYRAAMWVDDPESEGDRAAALKKLQGITNRLVADPARRTVMLATLRAGTAYARVPEPGACAFCLMLGSRGAVYDKDTVLGESKRYHDNCRCLAIEVTDNAPLPRINQDLLGQVDVFNRELGRAATVQDWRQWLDASRQQAGQETEWPRLKYVRIPKYKGDGMSTVFPGERLPPLGKMPGHVLHGWRDLSEGDRRRLSAGGTVRGWPHDESLADGHRWDSELDNTLFSRNVTDQEIVNAIRDALEEPEHFYRGHTKRVVWKRFDDAYLRVEYNVLLDGTTTFNTAYPEKKTHRKAITNAR